MADQEATTEAKVEGGAPATPATQEAEATQPLIDDAQEAAKGLGSPLRNVVDPC